MRISIVTMSPRMQFAVAVTRLLLELIVALVPALLSLVLSLQSLQEVPFAFSTSPCAIQRRKDLAKCEMCHVKYSSYKTLTRHLHAQCVFSSLGENFPRNLIRQDVRVEALRISSQSVCALNHLYFTIFG